MNMRTILITLLLGVMTAGCSGVEVHSDSADAFAAKDYRYYSWRTKPLPKNTHSADPVYRLDPVMRKQIDSILQEKGYIKDTERAQFTVDYLFAPGLIDGAEPEQASNISHTPSATINRQVDQASVDNAIALGGVKQTNNIVLQFNDRASKTVIWRAALTKIVENINKVEKEALEETTGSNLRRAMEDIPAIGPLK